MLVCKASPPGLLDSYQKNIAQLYARFPDNFTLLATVESINRDERWPMYREEVEELVDAGTPPSFYNDGQPWAAAIYRASQDRDWWKTATQRAQRRQQH